MSSKVLSKKAIDEADEQRRRLERAAPSLLKALQRLTKEVEAHLDYEDDADMEDALDLARRAIGDATGWGAHR